MIFTGCLSPYKPTKEESNKNKIQRNFFIVLKPETLEKHL